MKILHILSEKFLKTGVKESNPHSIFGPLVMTCRFHLDQIMGLSLDITHSILNNFSHPENDLKRTDQGLQIEYN